MTIGVRGLEYPPVYVFQLASQHASWLAARAQATASNIANADTPGYKAKDVTPFEAVLDRTGLEMAATQPGHLAMAAGSVMDIGHETEDAWDISATGNSVTLEAELIKVSETGRMEALDTGLIKTFHRMLLTSLKA